MKAHYLLDTETVKTYLVEQLKLFPADEPLDAEEIGDGNINYVFRVRSRANGKSVFPTLHFGKDMSFGRSCCAILLKYFTYSATPSFC